MLSRRSGQPLAQGFLRSKSAWRTCRFGGKTTNRQLLNFNGKRVISQVAGGRLWINKYAVFNYLYRWSALRSAALSFSAKHQNIAQIRIGMMT
jgi:hypothetical protein